MNRHWLPNRRPIQSGGLVHDGAPVIGLATALDAAGISLRHYRPGTHRGACPRCGRAKDDAMGVTVLQDGGAVWHCFRCGWAGAWRPREAVPKKTADAVRATILAATSDSLAPSWSNFWQGCLPLTAESPARHYLLGRGCALPPNDVRWHPRAWHPVERRDMPTVVALITDVITGQPISLHFTFIAPDGSGKASMDRPRLYLGRHRKAGGVIRLWADDEVTTGLVVGEGIETVLSAARAFTPAWSCLDAANLAAFPVLAGIESLTILADDDAAGEQAATACAMRWTAAGREARVWRRD
jgi:putative DNA primase/helicase